MIVHGAFLVELMLKNTTGPTSFDTFLDRFGVDVLMYFVKYLLGSHFLLRVCRCL